MKLNYYKISILISLFLLGLSCSSVPPYLDNQQTEKPIKIKQVEKQKPEKQLRYLIVNETGIHWVNEKTELDTLIIPLSNSYTWKPQSKLSPDKTKMAISYFDQDSIKLIIFDFHTLKKWTIHTLPKGYTYTFDWAPTSDQIAFGYYSEKK